MVADPRAIDPVAAKLAEVEHTVQEACAHIRSAPDDLDTGPYPVGYVLRREIQRDTYRSALEAALRENERLREALKSVAVHQLEDGTFCWCGVCEDEEHNGHSKTCNIARESLTGERLT